MSLMAKITRAKNQQPLFYELLFLQLKIWFIEQFMLQPFPMNIHYIILESDGEQAVGSDGPDILGCCSPGPK